ncbi:MAG TPA: hypothetical protein VJ698_06500 [Noviherbaspirillum sp.]|uniref:hypothetical protein n=1 Tax=Noviherbaspirillum sp. TaxID=1926288 RepID=UPI002B470A1F|nr:hypothetical protein [Noviherbaspirillum sp.]HJV85108.1 hypothetical protein [Noviherbaspirillum sp.]
MTPDPDPLIDADHAAFMQGGVGISVAACDAHCIPTLARATGCRVAPDRRRIAIFISASQAAPVLRCVRENRAIAAVFSEPPTHRTVQVKGRDATVAELAEGDLSVVAAYIEAFTRQLAPIGHRDSLVRMLLSRPASDLVRLDFTPTEAYSQTPGPRAGEPLQRRS